MSLQIGGNASVQGTEGRGHNPSHLGPSMGPPGVPQAHSSPITLKANPLSGWETEQGTMEVAWPGKCHFGHFGECRQTLSGMVGVEPGSRQGWHRASEGGAEWGRGLGSSITVKSPNTGPTPKAGCSRGQGFVMPSCALLPVRIRPSSQRQSFPKAPLSLPM